MDDRSWFTGPEHDKVINLDKELATELGKKFSTKIVVDCGVEKNSYHFRIYDVHVDDVRKVSDYARDWLATYTPFRFEVQCVCVEDLDGLDGS